MAHLMRHGILQERSPNVPNSINRRTTRSTPSTPSSESRRMSFNEEEAVGRLERASLLALACVPPDADEDDQPARRRNWQTPDEIKHDHDMNDLADCDGDSDDGGDSGLPVVFETNAGQDNPARKSKHTVGIDNDDACTSCDNTITAEELEQQQSQTNAP